MNKLRIFYHGLGRKRRFAIMEAQKGYWNGIDWGPKEKAVFYSDLDKLQEDFVMLEAIGLEDHPCKEFYAPIFIKVYGSDEFDVENLRDYLLQSAMLTLDRGRKGFGPNNLLVQMKVNWDLLKEQKPNIKE